MSKNSIQAFLASLKKSNAIEAKRLQAWMAERRLDDPAAIAAGETSFESPKYVAKALLEDRLLTKWQAKFLLSGRHQLYIGNYLLLERIGREEYGDRFLALHASLDRIVDLQLFSAEVSGDEERRGELIKKTTRVAKLDHPSLVHVFDVDQIAGQYFLVVEHVDGKMLKLSDPPKLDEAEIGHLIDTCLQGVQYAHGEGVVHGAIKPGDLILGKHGQVKIQNLALETFRRSLKDADAGKPEDDYKALSNIGLQLLKANKPIEQRERYEELKSLLTRMRKEGVAVLPDLQEWLQANPSQQVAEAPLVVDDDSGISTRNMSKPNLLDEENPEPGWLARRWEEHPVGLIGTIATCLLLFVGVAGWFAYQAGQSQGKQSIGDIGNSVNEVSLSDQDRREINDTERIKQDIASIPERGPATGGNQKKPAAKPPRVAQGQAKEPKTVARKPIANTDAAEKADDGKAGGVAADAAEDVASDDTVPGDPANVPLSIPKAVKEQPDDLKRIYGIGDARQQSLIDAGVKTYVQLAQMSPEELRQLSLTFNKFGIKPEDCERIVREAKEFAKEMMKISVEVNPSDSVVASVGPGKVSAKTADAKKPAAPKGAGGKSPKTPTPDLAKPFATFPERFDLPAVEDTTEKKIAPLVIRKQYLLACEVLSSDTIARGRILFDLERDSEDKQKWTVFVKRTAKQQGESIAEFRKSEDAFYFRWLPSAAENRNAPFLKNCFIRMKTPDNETAVLSLRRPIKVPPLRLDPATLRGELEFRVEEFPDDEVITVEIQKIPPGETGIDIDLPIVTSTDPGRILLKSRQQNPTMWLQINGDIQSKMKLKAVVVMMTPQGPKPVRNAATLDGLLMTLKQRLQIAQQNLGRNTRSEELKRQKNRAESDHKLMLDYVKALRHLLKQPIQIRVAANFEGYQAVLAVSDPALGAESSEE